jgi:hypothetical protein
MVPAQRKTRFSFGVLLTFVPIVLWYALPVSLFQKLAAQFHADDRLLQDEALLLGIISEIAAVYLLEHSRERPADQLSIFAIVVAILSSLAACAFFVAIVAISLHGW